jgi:VRR-NUC domain-containing protein
VVQLRLAPASEHAEQADLFRLVDLYSARYPALLNVAAIPNGGARHPATGARLKAEGVRAGYPDLFCAWPRLPFAGLFIELKTATGRVAPEQAAWHERLRAAGYRVEVCRGAAAAWAVLCDYLGISEEDR